MTNGIKQITLNIYADTDDEAEKGRQALIQFINMVGQYGAKVSGNKIAEAVGRLDSNQFIKSQIINFFRI